MVITGGCSISQGASIREGAVTDLDSKILGASRSNFLHFHAASGNICRIIG